MIDTYRKLLVERNSKLFIILSFFQNCWFIEGIWFFYWGRFANYATLGLVFSFLTICWVLAEIPTGLFADKFGRKKAVIVGYVCLVGGGIGLAAAQNIWWLVIGGFFDNIGRAFISGALEALVYDNLEEKDKHSIFDKLVGLRTQTGILAFSIAVIIGGLAYTLYFRLPNILMAGTNLIALAFAFFLKENLNKSSELKSLAPNFIQDTKLGVKELLNNNLKPFLIPIFLMTVVAFLFDWGFSRPAMAVSFGFGPKEQSFIFSLMAVISIFAVGFVPRIRKKFTDYQGLQGLNIVLGVCFMLSFLRLGFYGVLVMILIEMSWNMAEPWISIIVNKHIASKYRATTLSAVQFISKLPYVVINLVLGEAIDGGLVRIFHLGLGFAILSLILVNFMLVRNKNRKIQLIAN